MTASRPVSKRLRGTLVTQDCITERHREQMFSLMVAYYDNVKRAAFEADLNEKQWVIHLLDERNTIRGFSTQVLQRTGEATALFSGDTIVDRDYWAKNELARIWGRFALELIDSYPAGSLYWFLIAKGYKTYRFLPTFFHEYYPTVDANTPARLQQLISELAGDRYPSSYDATSGTISGGQRACRLRNGVAEVTPQRLRDRHVRFFVNRNPGHTQGDELCCIAPLTRENFTKAAYRVIDLPERTSAVAQ